LVLFVATRLLIEGVRAAGREALLAAVVLFTLAVGTVLLAVCALFTETVVAGLLAV
jgi:hypothetical protein